ncbi:collagen alpha-1(I) chain-like [Chionomys nivalis]|uniref:collagen alpha-1(I) chain-like n=1 Tax=Chionomys nivalis TaxID=269649 RepID=UPI00259884BB|nr:collagen alpha-1(I) chain-like [Chionomys nivalis]
MAEQAAQGAAPQRADEPRRPGPREQAEGRCSGVPRGRGKQGPRADWPPTSRERDPSKWASRGREQRSEPPSPEPGARARALRSLVEPARVARPGHVQREPLEWRAGDVSVPLPWPSPDPFPAHRVRFGTASVIRAGPALRRGHSQPGGRSDPGCVDPAAGTPPPEATPPRGDGGTVATTQGVIAGPARGRNTRAPGGRAGERAAASGARRLFPGAAKRSQPPPLRTGGLRAQDGSGPDRTRDTKGSPGKRDCGPATAQPGICCASDSLL